MPRQVVLCANPACRRPRTPGGRPKPDGLCWECFHSSRRALPREARKRGPYKTVAKSPAPKKGLTAWKRNQDGNGLPYLGKAQKTTPPASSWWICPRAEWSTRIAAQLPRFQSTTVRLQEPNREWFEVSL